MTEEDAYEKALQELQSKDLSRGIWAKAMAFSDGDGKKAESNYLKFRAEQLRKKEKKNEIEQTAEYAYNGALTFFAKIAPVLFSPIGRVSRLSFLLIVLGSAFTFALCIAAIDSASYRNEELVTTLSLPFFVFGGWSLICAHLKRAQDAGVSSSLAPIIIIFYCLLPIARFTGPSELTILHTIMFFAFLLVPSRKD
jgi:uncharacterized membrane protein YhaH (DUF805 family)